MHKIKSLVGVISIWLCAPAFSAQSCDVDLSRLLRQIPDGEVAQIKFERVACVDVSNTQMTVSNLQAIDIEVMTWRTKENGERAAQMVKLKRLCPGAYSAYFKDESSGSTKTVVLME